MKSHIIPEFLYKPLYADGDERRLLAIHPQPHEKVKVIQKGFWERLLCNDCEQHISKWENYAEKLLFWGNISILKGMKTQEFFVVDDIDYQAFKLFQISILWRAAVSTLPFFSAVELPEHEEHLRIMITGNKPGLPGEYGCIMMAVRLGDGLLDAIVQPCQVEIDGFRCIRFIMGGFMWMYVISQTANDFRWKHCFIGPEGRLAVLRERAENMEFFKRDMEKLRLRDSDVRRAARGRKGRRR